MPLFKRAPHVSPDFDPADFGLGVTRVKPITDRQIGELYAQAKEDTGFVIPKLERFLGALTTDQSDPSANDLEPANEHDD